MFTVYLIQHSISGDMYIGFTKNLKQRLLSHNGRKNRSTKKKNGEWVLIYAEAYRSERDARVRENKLKHHGSAKHSLKKRIKESVLKTKSRAG